MKLIDLVKDIEKADQEAVIFQEVMQDPNSDIILRFTEEGDSGVKDEGGRKYYYLIEVFLANEFIEDWKSSLNREPTLPEIEKRLYDYAINDA